MPENGLRQDELPQPIALVLAEVSEFVGLPVAYPWLMAFDHTHAGLRPGAYSIVLEGDYGWSTRFVNAVYDGKIEVPDGFEVYRGTGYRLDIYPADALAVR